MLKVCFCMVGCAVVSVEIISQVQKQLAPTLRSGDDGACATERGIRSPRWIWGASIFTCEIMSVNRLKNYTFFEIRRTQPAPLTRLAFITRTQNKQKTKTKQPNIQKEPKRKQELQPHTSHKSGLCVHWGLGAISKN